MSTPKEITLALSVEKSRQQIRELHETLDDQSYILAAACRERTMQRRTMDEVSRWLRLELRNVTDKWTRATLIASANALDGRTNPRLRMRSRPMKFSMVLAIVALIISVPLAFEWIPIVPSAGIAIAFLAGAVLALCGQK
jgi:hypothetical protein